MGHSTLHYKQTHSSSTQTSLQGKMVQTAHAHIMCEQTKQRIEFWPGGLDKGSQTTCKSIFLSGMDLVTVPAHTKRQTLCDSMCVHTNQSHMEGGVGQVASTAATSS